MSQRRRRDAPAPARARDDCGGWCHPPCVHYAPQVAAGWRRPRLEGAGM